MRDPVEAEAGPTGPPLWRSCWPTADETTLSLCCPLEEGPWLAGRAIGVLREVGHIRADPGRERYATGAGRGAPLIVGEPLLWRGIPAVLEVCQPGGELTAEVTVRLPPWAEVAVAVDEESIWELGDALAAGLRAHCAVVSDGRAIGYPDLSAPERAARGLQMTHLGVVVPPEWLAFLRPGSTSYRHLPLSDLLVVLE